LNHYPIDDSELLCAAEGCDNPYPCAQHQAFEAAACAPPFLLCNHGSSDAPRAGCTSAERCTAAGKCLAPLPTLPPPPPAEDDDQTRQDAPPAEVYQLNPDRARFHATVAYAARRRATTAAPCSYRMDQSNPRDGKIYTNMGEPQAPCQNCGAKAGEMCRVPTPYHPQAAAGVPEAIEDAPTLRLPGRARRNPLINGLDFDDPRRPQITAQRRIKVPEMRLNNPADLDQLIRELQALRPHMEQD
jgi:hypothetical protein